MTRLNEIDSSEIIPRDQLQSQIDESSKDDPFYSILAKTILSNADLEN